MKRIFSLKKIIFLFLFLFLAIEVLPAQHPLRPVNHAFDLSDVKQLETDGRFNIMLSQGAREKVEIEAGDEVVGKIEVIQKGKKLTILSKDPSVYEPVSIRITLRELEKVTMKGAGRIRLREVFSCKKLQLKLADDAVVEGDFRISESMAIQMKDNASLRASLDIVKSCRIKMVGYASAEVSGFVPSLTLSQQDAGKFGTRDFRVDKFHAKLSNTAEATLTVNRLLQADVRDAARLRYAGLPKVKFRSSSMAQITAVE